MTTLNPRTSGWRWFPLGLFAAMAVAFAVNGTMVYQALRTFPGSAGQDGFNLGNGYRQILETARAQVALGWQIDVDVTSTGYPTLRLADHNGTPMTGTDVTAHAERPVGPPETTALTFQATSPDRFQASLPLARGQWDIMLTVVSNGQRTVATRRIVVQ